LKNEIRKELITKRENVEREIIVKNSQLIEEFLFDIPEFKSSTTILFYASFRNEVDTKRMIEKSIALGKRILVPICLPETRDLILSELKSLKELVPGHYGVKEPESQFVRPVSKEEVEVVIVPGVAFDKKGYRLGYGAGYYDRLIERLSLGCTTIGLAFEMQILNIVPAQQHDMKVDIIITEERVMRVHK
jgi:5-formyltetrahydrofolate cyclo-ligase